MVMVDASFSFFLSLLLVLSVSWKFGVVGELKGGSEYSAGIVFLSLLFEVPLKLH